MLERMLQFCYWVSLNVVYKIAINWQNCIIDAFIWFGLGNKTDCSHREVNRSDGEKLAREFKVDFMETSAMSGLNVDSAFFAIAR